MIPDLPVIEEVGTGLFRMEVPLPSDLLLKAVNSYVVKGRERDLVIDTGMNRDACERAVRAGLDALGVDLEKTDFFITHHHGDHFGLVGRLVREGAVIYMDETDASIVEQIRSGPFFSKLLDFARVAGFPEDGIEGILPRGRAEDYIPTRVKFPFRFIREGQRVKAGEYEFQCLKTPGHSRGHVCLYEPSRKILLSGDHILADITPGIQGRHDTQNPLQEYLESLERIDDLDASLVLPGHRSIFRNLHERIRELREHHRVRADETLGALKGGSKTGYEVASLLTWNVVDSEGWDTVPTLQRFFAMGEAIAHLKYLESRGEISSRLEGGVVVYRAAGGS